MEQQLTWRDVPAGHFLHEWCEALNFLDDYQFEEFIGAEIEAWQGGKDREFLYAIHEREGKVSVVRCDASGEVLARGYCDLPFELAERALDTMNKVLGGLMIPKEIVQGKKPPV